MVTTGITLNEYQKAAQQTTGEWKALAEAVNAQPGSTAQMTLRLGVASIGLTGECGELAEKVKRVLRQPKTGYYDVTLREEMLKELGDVLWYCAELASSMHTTLDVVAQMNLDKLQRRYNGTFQPDKSLTHDHE